MIYVSACMFYTCASVMCILSFRPVRTKLIPTNQYNIIWSNTNNILCVRFVQLCRMNNNGGIQLNGVALKMPTNKFYMI